MIYEYRIYRVSTGRMQDLHARFRDHTLRIFERHGMKTVAFSTSEIGEYSDHLMYILAFDNLEHRERAWAAFLADPEWQRVKQESEVNGPLVVLLKNRSSPRLTILRCDNPRKAASGFCGVIEMR